MSASCGPRGAGTRCRGSGFRGGLWSSIRPAVLLCGPWDRAVCAPERSLAGRSAARGEPGFCQWGGLVNGIRKQVPNNLRELPWTRTSPLCPRPPSFMRSYVFRQHHSAARLLSAARERAVHPKQPRRAPRAPSPPHHPPAPIGYSLFGRSTPPPCQ